MVEVAGRPMLLRTMQCMRNVGVEEFVIIRGYKAEVFDKLDLGKVRLCYGKLIL
jgi:NDP-sugar pyrophosphorylase family protein